MTPHPAQNTSQYIDQTGVKPKVEIRVPLSGNNMLYVSKLVYIGTCACQAGYMVMLSADDESIVLANLFALGACDYDVWTVGPPSQLNPAKLKCTMFLMSCATGTNVLVNVVVLMIWVVGSQPD